MADRESLVGRKFHIVTRRLFQNDVRRHFAGEVTGSVGDLYEVRGYVFVFRPGVNEYRRRPELRTRIFSFADAGHVVNQIPPEVDLASLQYRVIDGRLVVTDTAGFTLDINEFGPIA